MRHASPTARPLRLRCRPGQRCVSSTAPPGNPAGTARGSTTAHRVSSANATPGARATPPRRSAQRRRRRQGRRRRSPAPPLGSRPASGPAATEPATWRPRRWQAESGANPALRRQPRRDQPERRVHPRNRPAIEARGVGWCEGRRSQLVRHHPEESALADREVRDQRAQASTTATASATRTPIPTLN